MNEEEIKKFIQRRLKIVDNDIAGIDEDVNIHGEIEDYKRGVRDALEWVLEELEEVSKRKIVN